MKEQLSSTEQRRRAKELPVPDDLMRALKTNQKALAAFQGYPPSHKNEYVKWIDEAKKQETRDLRIAKAIARMQA